MSAERIERVARPDRIWSYFKLARRPLALVTVSGTLYNVGMVAGPFFEGQLAQCLLDIMRGQKTLSAMLSLTAAYLAVILLVQLMRALKRYGVRRFGNDASRHMRHMLYNSLVHKSREELEREALGAVMTKAVADVDACVEGMRKFTTEVFDTGVVLLAYLALLFSYDWRLALLTCAFTPAAYLMAGGLKTQVERSNRAYKESAGRLNGATMDRVANAVTYRVYGCEENRERAYEEKLADYEKRSVAANLWENTMQPLYNIVAMGGAALIIYLGARNVLGSGWSSWNIAAFTTFLSCFTKLAIKSARAAKLFNAVQRAQVSWARIKPLMEEYQADDSPAAEHEPVELAFSGVSLAWQGGDTVLDGISFTVSPGEILGVTGPVACGKSTLGKALLGELPYGGSIRLNGRELRELTAGERSAYIAYVGHDPELISGSIAENIRLGKPGDIEPVLRAVELYEEVCAMPQGADTPVGSGGVRLSGGQQARLALARALYNAGSVLVLDDPFSAVDRATEAAILDNLRVLAAGQTILLLSHRLYQFPSLSGVLFLSGGEGTFSTHEALLREKSEYARLYREQTEGGERNEA